MANENAVMEWPEGNENWSGGRRLAQQCSAIAHGLRRRALRFITRNSNAPDCRGKPTREKRRRAVVTAKEQNQQTRRVPKPTVASAGGINHP